MKNKNDLINDFDLNEDEDDGGLLCALVTLGIMVVLGIIAAIIRRWLGG